MLGYFRPMNNDYVVIGQSATRNRGGLPVNVIALLKKSSRTHTINAERSI